MVYGSYRNKHVVRGRYDAQGDARMAQWLTSRNLADVHNRGKLNLPEFHVAMGLIYRGELSATHTCHQDPIPQAGKKLHILLAYATGVFQRDVAREYSSQQS